MSSFGYYLDRFPLKRWQLVGLLLLAWLSLVIVTAVARPLFPINELRYISVAWEMWAHHSFILPLQAGQPYAHKPPLLFWLIHSGWWMFGVNSWWPRLLPALFALGSLLMTGLLAQQLWPKRAQIAQLAPLLLLGTLGWVDHINLLKFDIMLSFFVLLSSYCLLRALKQGGYHWGLLVLSIGLALLAKGPVSFVFIVPIVLLAPWWFVGKTPSDIKVGSYYLKAVPVLLLAIVLLLAWAVPAALIGGHAYTHAIFWEQSVGRIQGGYGEKSWYVYFYLLAGQLFPWVGWLVLWQGLWSLLCSWRQYARDMGLRFIISAVVPAFIILSMISQKGERYLEPLLPYFILFFSYLLVNQIKSVKRYHQWLIALCYVLVGVAYLLLPHLPLAHFQHKYFWLSELSVGWGLGLIVLGIFWLCFSHRNHLVVAGLMSITTVVMFIIYNLGVVRVVAQHNDWRPFAQRLAQIEQQHQPIALYRSDIQFEFFGRLQLPPRLLEKPQQLKRWVRHHPQGWVVSLDRRYYPQQYKLHSSHWIDQQLTNTSNGKHQGYLMKLDSHGNIQF